MTFALIYSFKSVYYSRICMALQFVAVMLALYLCSIHSMSAKTRSVSGVVTDSITGERLPFASLICESNHKENRVANNEGAFSYHTSSQNDVWKVNYTGYNQAILLIGHNDTVLNVKLTPIHQNLEEVVVRPKKEKYSKKNNPAVDLVKRIREKGKLHDPQKQSYYSYDKYEKTLLALNDFNHDFSKGFLSKKGKFLETMSTLHHGQEAGFLI